MLPSCDGVGFSAWTPIEYDIVVLDTAGSLRRRAPPQGHQAIYKRVWGTAIGKGRVGIAGRLVAGFVSFLSAAGLAHRAIYCSPSICRALLWAEHVLALLASVTF